MKTPFAFRPYWWLTALLLTGATAASAQIAHLSDGQIRAETRRAERQARRQVRRDPNARELSQTHLNMSAYNMKLNEQGHRVVKAGDGRENFQFNKKGEAQVTDAAVLTRKRLRKKDR